MSFAKKIVTTYAKSLFQNVKNSLPSKTDTDVFSLSNLLLSEPKNISSTVYLIGEELSLLSTILTSSAKISAFFKNPTYVESQKLAILLSIFPGVSRNTRSFLKVLTDRSHLNLLPEIAEAYNELLLKFKKVTKVRMITATLLQESYGLVFLNMLRKITNGKEIILSTAYNPQLLGGFILEYNSIALDASILKEFSLFFTDL